MFRGDNMIEYAIENVNQEPVSLTFKEGREFGWRFDVLEMIVIKKLGFFNGQQVDISRDVKIYKGVELIFNQEIQVGTDTMGFEDTTQNIQLNKGSYMITVKSPHGQPAFYAESKNVDFSEVGIKYITGVYQNISDVGWIQTPNCYLASFEFELI
ncbi:MAG: hypothetical protein K0R18_529 [Bacillales bacterium]|jgi:hypothetical protein|nr:hypothetical protein [Bacillales bacterium]